MKALSVLVSVALCVLLASDRASADPAFSLAYEPETFVSSARLPTLDQTCAQVGDMSGCSGCVHGTKGLCAYVSTLVQDRPEKIYSYRCVSKATFGALVRKNKTVKDASKMCPKDPFAEPLVKGGVQVDGSGKKRQSSVLPTKSASQVASKTVKPGIVITAPTAQQAPSNGNLRTVDRTAATQPMGANQRPLPPRKRVVKEDDYACEKFVSLSVSTPEAFVECQNTAIEGYSYPTEAEKACISNVYSTWATFLCPQYGVAYNGFCATFANRMIQSCKATTCTAWWPWDAYVKNYPMIVSDKTPYCVAKNDMILTGIFQKALNFYVPPVLPPLPTPATFKGSLAYFSSGTVFTDIDEVAAAVGGSLKEKSPIASFSISTTNLAFGRTIQYLPNHVPLPGSTYLSQNAVYAISLTGYGLLPAVENELMIGMVATQKAQLKIGDSFSLTSYGYPSFSRLPSLGGSFEVKITYLSPTPINEKDILEVFYCTQFLDYFDAAFCKSFDGLLKYAVAPPAPPAPLPGFSGTVYYYPRATSIPSLTAATQLINSDGETGIYSFVSDQFAYGKIAGNVPHNAVPGYDPHISLNVEPYVMTFTGIATFASEETGVIVLRCVSGEGTVKMGSLSVEAKSTEVASKKTTIPAGQYPVTGMYHAPTPFDFNDGLEIFWCLGDVSAYNAAICKNLAARMIVG